jgi:threonine synthase
MPSMLPNEMVMKFCYICSECARRFEIDFQLMVCPECAQSQTPDQPLKGILEVQLEGNAALDFTISELLPVEKEFFPPAPVGDTPLWRPDILRKELGFPLLFIKDDGGNPTGSFKDRASLLVSAFAKKFGIQDIVLASTGNAGASMAGIGAAAGQNVTLFLPRTAPPAKLIQALQYGATVFRVDGPYDLAYDLSLAYSARRGGMNRNTAYNPMTIEGKKTAALEIVKALTRAPDVLFVPTGDGCILAGIYKGFRDLKQLDIIDTIPVIYAVQAKTSDALYRACQTGTFINRPTHSVADSICVNVPRNGYHVLALLKRYHGRVITVSDERIIAAQARLSRSAGLFVEPAAAAAFAGFIKVKSELAASQIVVVLTTGNGLKDSATAAKGIVIPQKIIRSIDGL